MRPRALAHGGVFVCALLVGLSAPVDAQQTVEQRLRQQQEELRSLRNEREELEKRMHEIRTSVHDLAEEVSNLDKQADVTARAVATLDRQLVALSADVDTATADLIRARDELVVKQAIRQRRLLDIYKRGRLYAFEALLSAESFAELVARYKYLRLLALRDRSLVERMEDLRDRIQSQRDLLVRLQRGLATSLNEKSEEERRLRALEDQRQTSLRQARRTQQQTEARLAQIARDESRLTNLLATLDAERRRAEARRPATDRSSTTFKPGAGGSLPWPVEGRLLYRFGRVVNPNNTAVKWNGVGIAAAAGTPVKAVTAGQVVVAEPFATYGLTVIVQHGGGDYSVYSSLDRIDVKKGQAVSRGTTLGTVGQNDPEMEAHLHFELRPQGRAVDPLDWLIRR